MVAPIEHPEVDRAWDLMEQAVARLYRAARSSGDDETAAMLRALNTHRWMLDAFARDIDFGRAFAVGPDVRDVRDIEYVADTDDEPDEPLWFEMAKALLDEPSPEVAEMLAGTDMEETDEDIAAKVREYRRRHRESGSIFARSHR